MDIFFSDLISWFYCLDLNVSILKKFGGGIVVSEEEIILMYKTSIILRKDTSMMKLNDIIYELVRVIESKTKDEISNNIMEEINVKSL